MIDEILHDGGLGAGTPFGSFFLFLFYLDWGVESIIMLKNVYFEMSVLSASRLQAMGKLLYIKC